MDPQKVFLMLSTAYGRFLLLLDYLKDNQLLSKFFNILFFVEKICDEIEMLMFFDLISHFKVVNRAGLGFGPGSGLTFRKISGLFQTRYDAYKQTFKKQNYSVTLYLFILCTLT